MNTEVCAEGTEHSKCTASLESGGISILKLYKVYFEFVQIQIRECIK
ncbi:hypothetical protein LV83_03208 [Algoriphagus yeomjeoni]|uniref:Uncharacterized protein n=1 Tax=Algoriphagus yeomjeoni TaxID=291403 RepID=A0A327P837_9BACT|nr:hypothetical protein LV83_03208 [Algoriphagus yeomjeoni]